MAAQRAAQISSHLNYPKGMLAGQTAIITGSGQGIGAECARLFANEGAKARYALLPLPLPNPAPRHYVKTPSTVPPADVNHLGRGLRH